MFLGKLASVLNSNFVLHREKKIEGLTVVRCLSAYHAPALAARLHETSLAVAEEVTFYSEYFTD